MELKVNRAIWSRRQNWCNSKDQFGSGGHGHISAGNFFM